MKQEKQTLTEQQKLEKLKKRQRRLMIFVLIVVLLWALLIWLVISLIPEGRKEPEPVGSSPAALTDYFAHEWQGYTLDSLDEQAGLAVVRGQSTVTYAQAERYGEVYDELMDTYVTTARGLLLGLQMDCGLDIVSLRLEQYSTDGQVIFSVTADGQIERCWEP